MDASRWRDGGSEPGRSGGAPRATLRRLPRSQAALVQRHLLALDPQSRHMRFGSPVSDDVVRRYVARLAESRAHLEGAFVSGSLVGLGELVALGERPREAEVAFSVIPAMRRRGIGEQLLRRLLLVARNTHCRSVKMVCLSQNVAMQRLARRMGGRLTFGDGEAAGVADVQLATPFSIATEAWLEGLPRLDAVLVRWGFLPR